VQSAVAACSDLMGGLAWLLEITAIAGSRTEPGARESVIANPEFPGM